MTTTTSVLSATGTILAIDLGKYKSVACAYELAAPGLLRSVANIHPGIYNGCSAPGAKEEDGG